MLGLSLVLLTIFVGVFVVKNGPVFTQVCSFFSFKEKMLDIRFSDGIVASIPTSIRTFTYQKPININLLSRRFLNVQNDKTYDIELDLECLFL